MSEAVEFVASVAKVQTLVDGGIRVTLDLPETAIMQAAQLMECKRAGVALDVSARPRVESDGHAEKGRKIHI